MSNIFIGRRRRRRVIKSILIRPTMPTAEVQEVWDDLRIWDDNRIWNG